MTPANQELKPDAAPAAFSGAHSAARISGNTLAGILVRHGIIDACAVEDAEGYDGGITMLRVRTAAQEISDTAALKMTC